MSRDACIRVALAQHGLVTLEQAQAVGWSSGALWKATSAGQWERLLPRVYRLRGTAESWEQSVMAACLWGGEGTAASHSSAARLWRLPGVPGSVHVVSLKAATRLPAWVNVHRVVRPPSGTRRILGIPVVAPWRALLDLGACDAGLVERALDEALRLGLVSLPQLRWALKTHGGPGRRGSGVLGPLVAAREARSVPPESELEAHLYRLVEASDLPVAVRQYPIWDGEKQRRLDLAFVEERVAVEVDGYWCHSGREAWQNDRTRDNAMIKLGWRTLRFTWEDLKSRPERVIADIRRTLVQKPH